MNDLDKALRHFAPDPPKKIDEASALVTFDHIIQRPPVIISIIEQSGTEIPVCTLGNFSVLKGKAKSRKSFLMSGILSAAIQGTGSMANIQGEAQDHRNMAIMFDTEMSRFHSQRMGFSVIRQLSDDNRDKYRHYALRQHDAKARKQFIAEMIEKYHGDCAFFVIDGIKDLLVNGINDEPEAIELTTWLMYLTEKYNIHIQIVLHENKNDKNARGHIGTEVTNKAETTFSTEKDKAQKENTIVKADFTRDLDFEPFAFCLDDNLSPIVTDFVPVKTRTDEKLEKGMIDAFAGEDYQTHSRLADSYSRATGASLPTAKRHISTALTKGIIAKESTFYKLISLSDDIPF